MKTVKKNVYYCDSCKKRSLSASAMNKHELRCTANPDRECGICNVLQGASPNIREIVNELKKRFTIEIEVSKIEFDLTVENQVCKWIGEPVTLEEIRNLVDGCPNCMLAILRQSRLNYQCCGIEFDYKAEFVLAMREVDAAKSSQEQSYHW